MFVFGVGCLYNLYRNLELVISFSFWKNELYKLLFASGVSLNFAGMNVEPLGIPWFFFALLIGRSLFDYFHLIFSEKKLTTICWMCSLIGILMGNTQWLPFSLDISLAIMPFFYLGYKMKNYEVGKKSIRKILVYGFVWGLSLLLQVPDLFNSWTYMELACRRYPIYPLCFATAICGVLLVCEISGLLLKVSHSIGTAIVSIGKNSMYLLCVHCIDYMWGNMWYVEGSQFRTTIKRCVIDLIVFIN